MITFHWFKSLIAAMINSGSSHVIQAATTWSRWYRAPLGTIEKWRPERYPRIGYIYQIYPLLIYDTYHK